MPQPITYQALFPRPWLRRILNKRENEQIDRYLTYFVTNWYNTDYIMQVKTSRPSSWCVPCKHLGFNPFATKHAYMRHLFHCLQWYAGSERVKVECYIFFILISLCHSQMYPENPEETQVNVGSMNMGYILRNRTHTLFRPKCEPIPLGHSDDHRNFQLIKHFKRVIDVLIT